MSCMIAHDFAIFCGTIYSIPSANDLDPWHAPLKKLGSCPKEIFGKPTSK